MSGGLKIQFLGIKLHMWNYTYWVSFGWVDALFTFFVIFTKDKL